MINHYLNVNMDVNSCTAHKKSSLSNASTLRKAVLNLLFDLKFSSVKILGIKEIQNKIKYKADLILKLIYSDEISENYTIISGGMLFNF